MINTINILELIQYKSEKAFDIIIESIDYNEDIDESFLDDEILTESAGDAISSFFDKICTAIKNIIERVKDTVSKLFTKTEVVTEITKIEKVIEQNPSFATKEVKVKNRKKMKELEKSVKFEIVKAGSVDELQKQMKKYRKQRNAFLAGSLLVTTSVAAVCHFILKGKKDEFDELTKKEKEARENVEKYKNLCKRAVHQKREVKEENEVLKSEVERLKADTAAKKARYYANQAKNKVEKVKNNVDETVTLQKAKASAELEVLKDATSDIVSGIREGLTVCKDATKNIIEKVEAGAKAVANVKTSAEKALDSSATRNKLLKRKEELKNEMQELNDKIEKAEKKINNPNFDKEKKKQLSRLVVQAKEKLDELREEYKPLHSLI